MKSLILLLFFFGWYLVLPFLEPLFSESTIPDLISRAINKADPTEARAGSGRTRILNTVCLPAGYTMFAQTTSFSTK